jgi:hypothetical protein
MRPFAVRARISSRCTNVTLDRSRVNWTEAVVEVLWDWWEGPRTEARAVPTVDKGMILGRERVSQPRASGAGDA